MLNLLKLFKVEIQKGDNLDLNKLGEFRDEALKIFDIMSWK